LLLVSFSILFAKEKIFEFDTSGLPLDQVSTVQLVYSNKQLILDRIDNLFSTELTVYYYAVTNNDNYGATLYNEKQPVIGISSKEHLLEFFSPKEKKLILVKLIAQAGVNYKISYSDLQLVIKNDMGETVSFEILESPVISEPDDSELHCTFESKNSSLMSKPTFMIRRIDNMITSDSNHKYTVDPVIAYFGFPYSVKLTPGQHKIDFKFAYGNKYSIMTYSMIFDFEAGKKYQVQIVDFKKTKKTGIPEYKIVEITE